MLLAGTTYYSTNLATKSPPMPVTVVPSSRTYSNCTVKLHWTPDAIAKKVEVHVYMVSIYGTNRYPTKELVFTSP